MRCDSNCSTNGLRVTRVRVSKKRRQEELDTHISIPEDIELQKLERNSKSHIGTNSRYIGTEYNLTL
jgi:hypothetical protein